MSATAASAGASATAAASSTAPFPPLPTDSALLSRISRWRRRTLPSPSLQRFVRPWYLLHLASVLAYLPVRCLVLPWLEPSTPPFEWAIGASSRETQMFLILGVLLSTKWRRSNTMETYVGTLLRYSKLAVLGAAFVTDMRLLVLFFAVFTLQLLVGPKEPQYSGPTNVKDVGLTFFQSAVDTKAAPIGGSVDSSRQMNYIVMLYSAANETCKWFQSEFARTSLHYGYPGSNVTFLRLSVDAFPTLLEQFQITAPQQNRFEHELPTLLMFQGGSVLARLPELGKRIMMNETNMIKAFDLEQRALVAPEVIAELSKSSSKAASKDDKKKTK